ncbi:MAG: PD-(D/E)XK nuclease family protein [bacterium]|nr:PD-(D/E)XK nuclease family protein [bacterium]
MGKIIEVLFSTDLIEFIADRILKEKRYDFSSIAVIFPHQRPGIYLRQIMAKKLSHSFFPPLIFSMDEFISFLAQEYSPGYTLANNLDSAYLLFKVTEEIPENPWRKPNSSFNQFLSWGLKLYKIIEELDIEMVKNENLKSIKMGDLWEPSVSRHAGLLMNHLVQIREAYHHLLKEKKLTTRGRNYALAAENIEKVNTDQFKIIYFAGLFAMTKAEKIVVQHFLRRPEVTLIRQNDESKWTPFEEMNTWGEVEEVKKQKTEDREQITDDRNQKAENRGQRMENEHKRASQIFLHSAFNTHCEVVGLKDILLSKVDNHEKTAIVLSDPEVLIPLLSEVMTTLPINYNITMGYPAVRTPVYALLDLFIKLQETKRENAYYLKDYLNLLMHPYVKSIRHLTEPTQTRILIHSVEETLLKQGKAFIDLCEVEQNSEIFRHASLMIESNILALDLKNILTAIHDTFIRGMDKVRTFNQLGCYFEEVLIFILKHSPAAHYPFSGEFFHSFFSFLDKIKNSMLKDEEFSNLKDLFDLFRHIAKEERIPFKGIPLKGLQILGILETRCLNFDKVFILRVNEGVLPSVESIDSLLPLPLKNALGIPSHYQNEEIYRYHFHHLISCAQEVHILYQENEKETKSRFVEKLIWEEEKKRGQIGVLKVKSVELNISLQPIKRLEIIKIPEILQVLSKMNFSASGLNSYLTCPAQFYFAKVLEIKEREKFAGDIDATNIGIIIHKVLEKLYQPFVGKEILGEKEYAHLEKNINKLLESVFIEKFGELQGEHYLLKEMALKHLKKYILLEKKKFLNKISIVSTEQDFTCLLNLKNGDNVCLSGKIDRIDRHDEEYLIIDYKTGNLDRHSFKLFNKILQNREEMKEEVKSFQLPFYVLLYQKTYSIPYQKINSKLVSLQTTKERFLFANEDREEFLENIFLPTIKNLIEEILNPEIPFISDYKNKECPYCPYPTFCRKVW